MNVEEALLKAEKAAANGPMPSMYRFQEAATVLSLLKHVPFSLMVGARGMYTILKEILPKQNPPEYASEEIKFLQSLEQVSADFLTDQIAREISYLHGQMTEAVKKIGDTYRCGPISEEQVSEYLTEFGNRILESGRSLPPPPPPKVPGINLRVEVSQRGPNILEVLVAPDKNPYEGAREMLLFTKRFHMEATGQLLIWYT